jgi:predicted Fe-S protein YdhL (DUF1289 family)
MQSGVFTSHSPEITSECPCTGYCTTGLGDEVCRNCLRTFDEITRWVEMSEDERRQVNLRIATEQSLN